MSRMTQAVWRFIAEFDPHGWTRVVVDRQWVDPMQDMAVLVRVDKLMTVRELQFPHVR